MPIGVWKAITRVWIGGWVTNNERIELNEAIFKLFFDGIG